MNDLQRMRRAARQTFEIDRLLGASWIPLGDADELAQMLQPADNTPRDHRAAPPREAPARPAPAGQPAPRRAAPTTRAAAAARTAEIHRQFLDMADRPLDATTVSPGEKPAALAALAAEHAAACSHCCPQAGHLNMVFGEGDPEAAILFVGEGPGEEEDRQGRPFVGRAGQLLDKQITAMGLAREQVYIANIVKTRPPGNRVPTPEEAACCMPYLHRQIEIIRPRVIVSLGATSAKYLLGDPKLAITRERGHWRTFRGIPLMPTFHPAYLLRAYTVDNRGKVWGDLKAVLEKAGLAVPKR